MARWRALLGIALLSLFVAACGPTPPPGPGTIADVAAADADLSTLVAALEAADLVDTLDDPTGEFTVFAPTNAAFSALLADLGLTVDELLADPGLSDILTYHVVAGQTLDADAVIASAPGSVGTVEGNDIDYAVVDGGVVLNGTVNVIATDIEASNGIIHKLDAVLLPAGPQPGTIAEVAGADGELSTLVAALAAAQLDAVLGDPSGQFTVFAPTDAAFTALLGALELTPEQLLASPFLSDILTYHVVSGATLDSEAVIGSAPGTVTTVQGGDISYDVVGDGVVLNGSVNVTVTDIEASNGVIHKIDAVLVPTLSVDVALSGANEVPPVETAATGTATVTFDGTAVSVEGTYENLVVAGPGAHVHGPAPAGENAVVVVALAFDNAAGTLSGSFEPTGEQIGWFLGGLLYINLHSEANPGGEIRGQIAK
jgi:uncharacterized surface protein with fasciclin (FAS1) repeats